MKQFKAITVDGEMALKRLPEMLSLTELEKIVGTMNIHFRNQYIQKYLQHLKEIESEPIIKVAPEYKVWKEGDVVREDEFEIKTESPGLHEKDFAIPKPKEDKGDLMEQLKKDLCDKRIERYLKEAGVPDGIYYLSCKETANFLLEHYSITKKTTTP